ncbi:MAG: sulfatase [Opitutales bacterium]
MKRFYTRFTGALCLVLSSCALSLAAKEKPNVLFIIFDDLNTRVSTSGYPNMITPNFDRLAREGMTFTRAYANYPVCGPSRASLLSGLYPQSTGVIDNYTDIRETRPGTISLPQAFKDQGYWTASVGKVFHNEKANHKEAAWDEFHYFENEELPLVTPIREKWEAENGKIDANGKNARAWRKFALTIAPQTANQKPGWGPTGLNDEDHKDGKNARQTVSWLKEKSYGEKPFFMAVGIHKPHGPYLAPDKYFEMYPKEELDIKPASNAYWETVNRMAMTHRYRGFDFELGVENDALRREYTQAYHACITFADAQVGLIFDALKESGEWDNTIIVMTSDHGYLLGEKFMWGKVMLWDMGTKVPMIVRVPGMTRPGSSSDSIVELVDIYPTLTQLAGLRAPDNLQGKSMVPIIQNPKADTKEFAYTVVRRAGNLGKTIMNDRYHYMAWPNGSEELYDFAKDPEEMVNLVNSPEHTGQLKRMREELKNVEAYALSESTELTRAAIDKANNR